MRSSCKTRYSVLSPVSMISLRDTDLPQQRVLRDRIQPSSTVPIPLNQPSHVGGLQWALGIGMGASVPPLAVIPDGTAPLFLRSPRTVTSSTTQTDPLVQAVELWHTERIELNKMSAWDASAQAIRANPRGF